MPKDSSSVLWFSEIEKEDLSLVGQKGASLGEMTQYHFPVPNGFVITSSSYFRFIRSNELTTKITNLLSTVNFEKPDSLLQVSYHIQQLISKGTLSDDLLSEIFKAYTLLSGPVGDKLVAVRPSPTSGDTSSFPYLTGQLSYMNVKGDSNLIFKIKEVWADMFNPKAIAYRNQHGLNHFQIGCAIVIQQMVESSQSGLMLTADPVTGDKSTLVIEAILGLGELLTNETVTPDHYEVNKKELKIIRKRVPTQEVMLVKQNTKDILVKVSKKNKNQQKISDQIIMELSAFGKKLERHYYFPQKAEWAVAGNKVYLVLTQPITSLPNKKAVPDTELPTGLSTLAKGAPGSSGIKSGYAKIVLGDQDTKKVLPGDILITPQISLSTMGLLKKTAAVVTEKGGRMSYAGVAARDLGIPAVVGTDNATSILKDGQIITVNGATGEVYGGAILKSVPKDSPVLLSNFQKTATKVYIDLVNFSTSEAAAQKPSDGIGLFRSESIFLLLQTHPKKLIADGNKNLLTTTLVDSLKTTCAAFNPRPVYYKFLDLKSEDLRALKGGRLREPAEANTLLGFHGALRSIRDPEIFKLELSAINLVRTKFNHKNLSLIIPFVRTLQELRFIKQLLKKSGLHRSPTFQLIMMVETPAVAYSLDKYIKEGIDGVCIGSDTLGMLTLGIDKNNNEVSSEYNPQDPAILSIFEQVVKTAQRFGISSGICGSATKYSEILEKLISLGLTSVTVPTHDLKSVRQVISDSELGILSNKRTENL